jgi:hypothetical protein
MSFPKSALAFPPALPSPTVLNSPSTLYPGTEHWRGSVTLMRYASTVRSTSALYFRWRLEWEAHSRLLGDRRMTCVRLLVRMSTGIPIGLPIRISIGIPEVS